VRLGLRSDGTTRGLEPREIFALSFADVEAGLYGQARLQPDHEADRAHALVAVFAGTATLVAEHTPVALDQRRPDGAPIQAGPLRLDPGGDQSRWSAGFAGGNQGDGAFTLELEALGDPVELWVVDGAAGDPQGHLVRRTCRVRGTVSVSGRDVAVDGPGELVTARGAVPQARAALVRELDAWMEDDGAIALHAVRPATEAAHDQEQVTTLLVEGEPPRAQRPDESRLSTAYDAEGRQSRAGLELWPREDSDYPRRVAGEALCGATVVTDAESGAWRWDCVFMEWHMEGRRGTGPYSLLRRQND
jgi:hypothetical protein